MRNGPDIASPAALLGDPARSAMMTALLDGVALTAGELAREAGVGAATASAHLAKLEQGRLIRRRRQGRHSYFSLAGEEVAAAMEALMGLAERSGLRRTRPGPRDAALRQARVCYDHLAGEAGVSLYHRLLGLGCLSLEGEALKLTPAGGAFFDALGVDLAGLRSSRRPLARACLDWSERQSHLAGALGAAVLERLFTLGWARRDPASRAVSFTGVGQAKFATLVGRGQAPRESLQG